MRRSMTLGWVGMQVTTLLSVLLTVGCPPAQETATLRVLNTTAKTVTAVYCTPTTDDSWGPNLIFEALGPGESVDITGFVPGEYDMLAVFADATEVDWLDINFDPGEIQTWNLLFSTPSGKGASAATGIDGYIPLDSEDGGEVRLKN